jgi:hypothetical protein
MKGWKSRCTQLSMAAAFIQRRKSAEFVDRLSSKAACGVHTDGGSAQAKNHGVRAVAFGGGRLSPVDVANPWLRCTSAVQARNFRAPLTQCTGPVSGS